MSLHRDCSCAMCRRDDRRAILMHLAFAGAVLSGLALIIRL